MNRYKLLLVATMMLFSIGARSEWAKGEGDYFFGPDLSENEACERADRRAQEAAMRKINGERISSDDIQVCAEMKDSANCSLNRFTWSTIDGVITGVRDKNREMLTSQDGHRFCHVSLEVDVRVGAGRPDPKFDMTVQLNHPTFRHGEFLEISVEPIQPMYISVFQWLPYQTAGQQVSRIFPNRFEQKNKFLELNTIPTDDARQPYNMTIRFPDDLKGKKRLVDEYLMIIGTREQVEFRETYALKEFNQRLLEIPRYDLRKIKKAYNVVTAE